MICLAAVLALAAAADKTKDPDVAVDSVTVNGDTWKTYPPEGAPAGEDAPAATARAHSHAPMSGQLWSVVAPRTVGANGNQVEASVGYPGVTGSYLHGVLPNLDVGGRLTANYGYEGQVYKVEGELKIQAQVKYRIFDTGKVSLGASFAPGPLFLFPNGTTVGGFTLPIGLNLGIVATSAINVGVTFEIPFWLRFGTAWGLVIPVLTGVGAEYFISSAFNVWASLRMGPSLWTNGLAAQFTLDSRVGIGWRF